MSPVKNTAYFDSLSSASSLNPAKAREFLIQWYAFSCFIPKLLSLCAYKSESEPERMAVLENLYSELGKDHKNGQTHPELLRDLIEKAYSLTPSAASASKTTKSFLSSLETKVLTSGSAYVCGLLQGLEHVAYDILDVLKEILTKTGNAELVNHPYIYIHEEIEKQHIANTEHCVNFHEDKPDQVKAGFNEIMVLWEAFWTDAYASLK